LCQFTEEETEAQGVEGLTRKCVFSVLCQTPRGSRPLLAGRRRRGQVAPLFLRVGAGYLYVGGAIVEQSGEEVPWRPQASA
jgi:hypothetical protein